MMFKMPVPGEQREKLQGTDKEQKQTAPEPPKIYNKKRSILIFFIISVTFR